MQRRTFIRNSGLFAIAIGAFGNIRWVEDHFSGDTFTTTEILGPFYRPGAPIRTNLNATNFAGEILDLSGTIFNENGNTPMNNCLKQFT